MPNLTNTQFGTTLQPDPPLDQSPPYRFGATDRSYIDGQIRGIQQLLTDLTANGVSGTWLQLDASSPGVAVGDVVCSGNVSAGTVTKATAAKIALAGRALGVVLVGAAPGAKVKVALAGFLTPLITSLGATSGFARVSATGRVERVATLGVTDYGLGTIDAAGNLSLGINQTGSSLIGSLSGDVTGPPSTTVVQALTGTAGVVTLASGTKITSGVTNIGDLVRATVNSITIGNATGSALTSVTLQSSGAVVLESHGSSYINLSSVAQNYIDGTDHIFRTSAGAEQFRFVSADPSFKLDSGSGTFPSIGLVRFKNYVGATTIIGYRNAGGDSPLLAVNGTSQSITIGDSAITTGSITTIQGYYGLNIQVQGSVMNFYASTAGFQFSNWGGNRNLTIPATTAGGAANLQYGENVIASITQATAVTNTNGTTFSIAAQAAKVGGAGNGGTLALASGAKDGAGTDGTVTISTGATQQASIASGGTWTLASNTTFTSAGAVVYGAGTQAKLQATTSIFILVDAAGGNVNAVCANNQYVAIGTTGQDLCRFNCANAGAGSIAFDTAATSITIKQNDNTSSPSVTGSTFKIQAQNATGTTSDGGKLQLTGGTGTTAYGSVILLSPFNPGFLSLTPSNGANTLTTAQSAANVVNCLAGASAGYTLTFARRIADTSILFVRNNTTQLATISYLTGGTVTVATNTSAFITSDGANLIKIVIGT